MEIDFLENGDFIIETYPTGELCMANLSHDPDVIILEYFLDGIDATAMNGIDTLDKIKAFNQDILVVMGISNYSALQSSSSTVNILFTITQ